MLGGSPSLFDGLGDDERQAVLAEARRNRFRKGEIVFHAGDPGDTLHLIERGHVAIRASTPRGDIATFAVLGPGEVFGELALLDPPTARSATAAALDVVTTRSMDRAQFQRLRATYDVDRFLLAVMAATVRRVSEQLMEALYVPAETRVLRRVAYLADAYAGGAAPIAIPVTQDDVATLAGVARPTANRILRAVQEDGVLTIRRGCIEILDPAALAQRAR